MIERTALEIALDLDAASCSSFAKLEAAEALRKQHAEIERLRADLAKDAAPDLLSVCHRLSEVNVFSVESDVASIIMQACDAVSKATGKKT